MLNVSAFRETRLFVRTSVAGLGLIFLVLSLLGGCGANPVTDGRGTSAGSASPPGLESGRYAQTSAPDGQQSTWVFRSDHLFERITRAQVSGETSQPEHQPDASEDTASGKAMVSGVSRGRWWTTGDNNQVVVETGSSHKPVVLEPLGNGRLLIQGRDTGNRRESSALVRTGDATPLTIDRPMQVCFISQGDAPIAYDPRARRHFPVLMDAAYPALKQAYLNSGLHPPAHLPVAIKGRWVLAKASGKQEKTLHLKATAFDNVIPGKTAVCPLANLTETFWALESLDGQTIHPDQGQREINLRLTHDGRAFGLAGCNRFGGAWVRHGDILSLGQLATTKMMCPDRADTEQRYLEMLDHAKRFAIEANTLYLMDEAGRDLAVFGARYFN